MTRILAFLFILLATPPASAATRLDTLLARGEALTARGDVACAEPLEAAAFAAESNDDAYARALGALGLCREIAGRFGEAHRLVSRALEGAPAETTAAGKAPRWMTLRAALRRLDDRVARVLVTFDGDLWIDGHPVVAVSGAVLAVDPGRRLFEARKGGRTIAAREVEVRAGDLPSVKLHMTSVANTTVPLASVSTVAYSAPSFFTPALTPRGVSIAVAYVGLGTSLVSLIVAGVLEAQRGSLASGLARDACPTPDASARCAELAQVFQQRTGARNVALVTGGVAVLASGVAVGLWLGTERQPAGLTIGGAW